MSAVKLIPLLLSWAGIVVAMARYFPGRQSSLRVYGTIGFMGGVAGCALLFATFRGSVPFSVIKTLSGTSFLCLWGASVAALYRVAGPDGGGLQEVPKSRPLFTAACSIFFTGLLAGGLGAGCLIPQGAAVPLIPLFLLALAAALLTVAAVALEPFFPNLVTLTGETLFSLAVSLLLFASSFSMQLDLFAPLTMKVMKFIHDFVHQFFESMLFPDHPFFRPALWDYVGYLFSSGVGFWGGLIIWFAPVIMIAAAVQLSRLPPVAHIRQGAKRRKLLAAFIRERRYRLIVPCFATLILAAAVYKSRFPGVEYWDPKPVAVTMKPSGEIFIPKKGEIDLEDGKLHKYLFKQGGREVRFIVLKSPEGGLTVTLDACAICKPDGYGQTEGAVICYYCKTLIPLETVGKPGGCNPVPVPFSIGDAGVSIDAATMSKRWGETVNATSRIEGGGK